jgi:hypothetical protein
MLAYHCDCVCVAKLVSRRIGAREDYGERSRSRGVEKVESKGSKVMQGVRFGNVAARTEAR